MPDSISDRLAALSNPAEPSTTALTTRGLTVVRARYNFASQGGAQGTLALGPKVIPAGCVIVGGFVDVLTQLTSGGAATIACQVEAANDILTAVAVATWTAGRKNILPAVTTGALTAATAVKTTAARAISIVIATADLTAGKFDVVLYVVPDITD